MLNIQLPSLPIEEKRKNEQKQRFFAVKTGSY
jgi:hypothetical protein